MEPNRTNVGQNASPEQQAHVSLPSAVGRVLSGAGGYSWSVYVSVSFTVFCELKSAS